MAYDEVHDYFQEEYNRSTRRHLEERGLGGEFCMCDVRLGLESCWSDRRGKGVAGRIYVDR